MLATYKAIFIIYCYSYMNIIKLVVNAKLLAKISDFFYYVTEVLFNGITLLCNKLIWYDAHLNPII